MFPEPTELLLIGYSIESIWTLKSKSSTLTPKTNSQTCWPRETSHVMNGIIFCVCLTLAISVPQIVLKWCRKERKKMQVKKESQQNRSRWWIWSRDAAKGFLMCYLLLHQKAVWKPDMKVNFLWARQLSSITEQSDLLKTLTHQAAQNGMLIKLGLLKTGNLMNRWKIEHGDLLYSHSTHRSRIRNVVKIQIILAQGEWSSAKEAVPMLKRCNKRQRQPLCDMWNVYVFDIGSICLHGEELLRQLTFHQKYRRSHTKTDVRHIWKVNSRTIRWDLWSDSN